MTIRYLLKREILFKPCFVLKWKTTLDEYHKSIFQNVVDRIFEKFIRSGELALKKKEKKRKRNPVWPKFFHTLASKKVRKLIAIVGYAVILFIYLFFLNTYL